MNAKSKIKWIYNSKNNEELAERYNVWAKDYDQDLVDDLEYVSPQYGVDTLSKYVSKNAKILDAGAGTGLVGQILHQRGYHNLVGMDISEGMLDEARKKEVYTTLHQGVMGEPLGFPTAFFDAIISIGVFADVHAPASAFDELIRITKTKGYIIFSVLSDFYENSGFKDRLLELERTGQWKWVEIGEKFQSRSKIEADTYGQVIVYRVC